MKRVTEVERLRFREQILGRCRGAAQGCGRKGDSEAEDQKDAISRLPS